MNRLIISLVFGFLTSTAFGQMQCNLCNNHHGCCLTVINSKWGGYWGGYCVIDSTHAIKLNMNDRRGGMSFTFMYNNEVCFDIPAIGNITFPQGGSVKNRLTITDGLDWSDRFVLDKLQKGGYSVCWENSCCMVKNTYSGSCKVPGRTLYINLDPKESICPLDPKDLCRFGSIRMTDSHNNFGETCLDNSRYGNDYMAYWDVKKCA